LLDLGASSSTVSSKITKKLSITKGPKHILNTAAGPNETPMKTKVQSMLPESLENKISRMEYAQS